jgi:hypothetical protein
VKLWDVKAKGEQEGPEKAKSSVWAVRFAPGGKAILVGTHAGAVVTATPAPKLLPPPPPKPTPPPPPPSPPAPPQAAAAEGLALKPTEFKSAAGATATIADDASVLVAGTLAKDTYTVKTVLPADGAVKAFVLEALPDGSLPKQGPGRAENGNFVISTFGATFTEPAKEGPGTAIRFTGALADFAQDKYNAEGMLDADVNTGWAIDPEVGKPHVVRFTLAPDVKLPAGATVTFTMDQQYSDGRHTVGKFRLRAVKQ